MDYEENDFQSENHRLAGEGSTKFPPSLRPYALPKFDFDENHLRFDSLVETEVFLGIESNEGNRWIEDFSRGSGGIEFSTSAGESCSITRRNNVWSEATSSESVEMLLKSVGQEEFIHKEAIVEVSDACDELGCLTTQMEPDLGHDGSTLSDQCTLSMPEASLPVERDSADAVQIDATDSVDKSLANQAKDDLSNPEMLVHNSTESLSELKKHEADKLSVNDKDDSHINSELPGQKLPVLGHVVNADEQELNNNGVEDFSHHSDQPSSLGSKSEHIMQENVVGAASAAGLDPPDVVLKGNNSEVITTPSPQNSGHENVVSFEDRSCSEEPIIGMHSASMVGREIGAQDLEVTDKKAGNSSTSELSADQSDSVTDKGNQLGKVHQVSGSLADSSLASSVSVKEFSGVNDGSINCDARGASSNNVLCSSEEALLERHSAKIIEGLSPEVCGNDTETEKHVLIVTLVERDNSEDFAHDSEVVPSAGQEDSAKLVLESGNQDDAGDGAAAVHKNLGTLSSDRSGTTSTPLGGNGDAVNDHTEVNTSPEAVLPSSELDGKVEAGVAGSTQDSSMQLSSSISAPEQDPLSDSVLTKSSSNPQLSEIKVGLESNMNMEARPRFLDASEKEGAFVGAAVHRGNQDELPPKGDNKKVSEVAAEGSDPANPDKRHGSPLVSKSTEQLFVGNEKVKVKGSSSKKTQAFNAERDGTRAELETSSGKQIGASKDGDKSEVVPPLPGLAQPAALVEVSNAPESPQIVDGGNMHGGPKSTPERKIRRSTGRAAGKESGRKGSSTKEGGSSRRLETMGKSSNLSMSLSGLGHQAQTSEAMQHGPINTKPFGVHATPTSTSSEFNYSAFPSMVFQQPFTDMQQLQLRAQIFVYGSLISKQAPEEAHMVSAFGGSDGSRSMWEKVWRACKERIHSQTLHSSTPETPLLSRSGDMPSDQAVKQSALQNKVSPPPATAGRASSKGTPSPIANPMIPLSSPLWSIPTPSFDALQSSGLPRGPTMDYQRAFPPLQPHQTPPVVNFVGHSSSWMSPTPFHAPWTAPQTSLLDTSARFPTLPTEAVQLTPVRESHVALSSGIKSIPSPSTSQNGVHANFTVGSSASPDPNKLIKASGQPPTDPKSKRRRKVAVSEEKAASVNLQQSQSEPVTLPAPVTDSHPVVVTTTTSQNLLAKCNSERLSLAITPTVTNDHLKAADKNTKRSALSEETLGKLKEARQQAEDAAALACAAVSRGQEVWDQLEKQKNSGLVASAEAKLASATAAITAAASVAKAAAAAANVASNAALQAKVMADEAFNPSDCGEASSNDGSFFSIDRASPVPMLKGDVGMSGSSSIIVAAKEAARRRVEAASAAALQAKNLDAIVKAAELAAEAISQAGKIVAMGDPLLLSKLVETGQLGIWNISEQATKVQSGSDQRPRVENAVAIPRKHLAGDSESMEVHMVQHDHPTSGEKSGNLREDPGGCADGVSGSVASGEMRSREGLTVTDLATTTEIHNEKAVGSSNNDGIREGSYVEVFKDRDRNKPAWFSAEVITLKDGKAYVCYTELKSGEGRLKEWVELKGEGDMAPKVRIACTMTATHFEGTKKRRRAAMGYLTCSVGDKVDVWMHDSWCEGVVTEKGKKDETTVTVCFPAHGDTSVVKVWHLRPSLVWKDGEWVEWSSTGQHSGLYHEGDTPREKRPKLGSAAESGQRKDVVPQNIDVLSGKSVEQKSLNLPANERTFNIGKSSADERRDTRRVMRAGLRKEGAGVIFGVPKPGKKRKFMEVSKHYVDDKKSKVEVNDSVKLANYLMPRGTGSRRLKNSSKTDMKEKQTTESKSKIPTFGKPRGAPGKRTNQESSLPTRVAGDSRKDNAGKSKDSSVNSDNPPGKHSVMGFGSFSGNQGAEGPFLFSSLAFASDATSSKKISSSTAKDDKGKPASGSNKASRNDDKGSNNGNHAKASVSETLEPRRSNRRIQPTSRLLEGLQSSLIVSKIPSVPHDRGHRSSNRSSNKG